ncbi:MULTISPECIES: hypothetical protein [Chryseobacterium]|uniref:hypothetical protein n=1 Tax=Chryseobacterium TaxID=59732 RepID=UPI001297C538|nr:MULTISPECIES: hypothetical protein [Chryseobacterium]MDR6921428.1 hypothetical protein [Chryseobacterium sp. 2987]
METTVQYQEQIQYAEVYISDMPVLKNIFLQRQPAQAVHTDFGVPFLLAKKRRQIIMFASLVIHEKGGITFKIYHKKEATEPDKQNFYLKAESYFKQNTTSNFRNPEQLKSSIKSMISWLDF